MSKRDEYTRKLKIELDSLNAKMDVLEAKTQEAKEDVRDAYKAEVAKLRHQSELAAEKYEELKAATEDSWHKLVAETERIRDAFVHSFNYFKSQI